MPETVIQAENISKLYHLGTTGSGSLKRDLQMWWDKKVKKKQDMLLPEEESFHTNENFIWALRNVNFEIKEGEAWGIIGRNGAGKSTLLKILSRIIKPTQGHIRGKGKVSSLLEIGTGFHPDLTGRENIFNCGHMLGMNKREILQKFDEIVDFSGVEQFLNTPVKRYSSGMYVRLAFSVAAHLEPDILIVDEVLAVGDADFQRKCLGKMKDQTQKTGRTIIFVSHNLQAITNLCPQAIWLEKGTVHATGASKMVVNKYLGLSQNKLLKKDFSNEPQAPGNDLIRLISFEIIPQLSDPLLPITIKTPLRIKFKFYNASDGITLAVGIHLFTLLDECIFDLSHTPQVYKKGFIEGECEIPGNFLNDGSYYMSIIFVRDSSVELFYYQDGLYFDVEDSRENLNYYDKWMGYVRPDFPIQLTPANE
ncbi:MAG TPA: ABC transporter ATP-binding protein [Mucilaginibacter sp.]|jgi:lipopolysaccharide transport system ATP-binding protein